MILSDISIRQRLESGSLSIVPAPVLEEQLQPASLDVRLGGSFLFFKNAREVRRGLTTSTVLDTRSPSEDHTTELSLPVDSHLQIEPGEFVLATTLERVTIPDDLVARVEGRSSLGRLGLTVHVTAGFIDPGFSGNITLEIANLNSHAIVIYVGMRIAQLAFQSMTTPAERPYGHPTRNNKYQGQNSVTASRIEQDE